MNDGPDTRHDDGIRAPCSGSHTREARPLYCLPGRALPARQDPLPLLPMMLAAVLRVPDRPRG